MTLPERLLAVRDVGDLERPYWTAASEDGEQLVLEPGETQQWAGRCRVRSLRPNTWELPDSTLLVVTDRRTAFLTTAFDKGGGWAGFGAAGLAVATTANAISKRKAAKRSGGKVAIGHLRHEWVQAVELRIRKPLFGVDRYVDITVATAGGSTVIELFGRGVANEEFTHWLVATVAWPRQGLLTEQILPQDRATLELLRAPGGPQKAAELSGSTMWQLPGDTESLISAARERCSDPD
jgi:hypothetical protein